MLVDDLLDVSRIVLGKFTIEREIVILNDVLNEAVAVVRPISVERSIALECEIEGRPLVARGDPRRLKQVIWNLLTNAMKFTHEGGRVRVRLERRRERGTIVVADDGAGIEASVLPHVFDRFRQGTGSVKKGGLGLGLSICRSIVEEHGGSISIHSDGPGSGTTVTVEVPLVDERVQSA
jgi:signal transduction histidine kinase